MCRTGKSNCRAAKMVVASTYKLSYLCSAESTVREGVKAANLLTHPARMDAPIHVKRLYRASGWLLDGRVDLSSHIALQTSNDFSFTHSLCGATTHICLGTQIVTQPDDDYAIERRVGPGGRHRG